MPKSGAKTVKERVAGRRQRARDAGLCYICCEHRPNLGRTVCVPCNAAKSERKKRKRRSDREIIGLRHIITAHEKAGDITREHHLYEDAAQYYQDALNIKVIDSSEHTRISEKLAYVLALSTNPQAAAPFFDHVLNSYLREPVYAEKTIELLLQQARQRWFDRHIEDALPLIAQAVRIADVSGVRKLRTQTRARMTNYLLCLNRFDEAKELLQTYGDILSDEDVTIVSTFVVQKAIIAAVYGEKERALAYFDRAIATAGNDPDPLQLIAVWHIQSVWMLTLGETHIAKISSERALLLARQQHIPWLVCRHCLEYADMLFLIGEFEKAREYFVQALAYETSMPLITETLAGCGLPIALQTRDTAAIARITHAFDPQAILQASDPGFIAGHATVFAHWHIAEGRNAEAEQLLHQAVSVLPIKHFCDIWNLPIAVARYGGSSDFRQARKIIETRAALPCASVAQATQSLFDAYVANREGRYRKALRCAKDAAQRFEVLGWYSYVDLAKTLISSLVDRKSEHKNEGAFSEFANVLTLRQREVARLLRKGLTNQEIAQTLSISKHTVHAHVASIMSSLGLRSRHQIANIVSPDMDF